MSSTYYEEIMRLAPLRYYPLADAVGSGTAKDVSGSAQNGTKNGTVTFGQASLLKANSLTSALFDGTSGYISAGNTGLPTGNATWTMLAWCKMPASLPGGYPTGMQMGAFSLGNGAGWLYNSGAFYLEDGSSLLANSGGNITIVGNGVYLVGITNNGSTAILYVNGANVASFAGHTFTVGTTGLDIGNDGTGSFWSGALAHAAVFSSVLSPDQMAWLYAVGQGAVGVFRSSQRAFGRLL